MKKIINQKRYDTETAKEIGCWSNNLSYRDFNWCVETLYQKKTGEYFLHGEGGPRTRYAERLPDGWSSGEELIPLSYEEARQWAEEHLTVDEYEETFGEVTEDDSKIMISLTIPAYAVARLKQLAAKTGKTQSDLVAEMIMHSVRYSVFITGGNDDGKEVGWFDDEQQAIKFARAYMEDHESELDTVCGGIAISDNKTNELVENW